MSNLPISNEKLIHSEIEALKVSVVMLKIDEQGKVSNRILVHKDDIQQFKNLGYAENIKKGYDPQIGHSIEFKHVDLQKQTKELIHNAIIKKLNFWNRIKFYFKRLIRMV